jgi:transglutaminase-like putative cysteine protease
MTAAAVICNTRGLSLCPALVQTAVRVHPMVRRIPLLLLLLFIHLPAFAATARDVDATLVARLSNIPVSATRIKVWIPLPKSTASQSIQNLTIDSSHNWKRYSEPEFGNDYLYAEIENPKEGMELLQLHFRATRREVSFDDVKPIEATSRELRRNLRQDRLVTISPRIRQLAGEVTREVKDPLAQAKAIYEYVLTTMKYDKSAPGWGNGDTERACDLRSGNCTDFHSLFISLARAKGIPARFIIGFPMSAKEGRISGYHCWAEFHIQGKGWIPVDPSEASKSVEPARRQYLFGNLDADRIQFTIGRDLRLTPPTAEPLNFFIYPHAEVNGEKVGSPAVSFVFRERGQSARAPTSKGR